MKCYTSTWFEWYSLDKWPAPQLTGQPCKADQVCTTGRNAPGISSKETKQGLLGMVGEPGFYLEGLLLINRNEFTATENPKCSLCNDCNEQNEEKSALIDPSAWWMYVWRFLTFEFIHWKKKTIWYSLIYCEIPVSFTKWMWFVVVWCLIGFALLHWASIRPPSPPSLRSAWRGRGHFSATAPLLSPDPDSCNQPGYISPLQTSPCATWFTCMLSVPCNVNSNVPGLLLSSSIFFEMSLICRQFENVLSASRPTLCNMCSVYTQWLTSQY